MKKTITIDTDAEALKDIVWAIKGMNMIDKKDGTIPLFKNWHIEALENAIEKLQNEIKEDEK